MTARRILIADDDNISRRVLSSLLGGRYDVVEADSGEAAVRAACAEDGSPRVDAILMDLAMPGVGGCRAAELIKQRLGERHLPIIFITATLDESELAHGLDSGGDDFLVKPVGATLLHAKLDALLRAADLFDSVREQKNQLSYFKVETKRQHTLARHIRASVTARSLSSLPGIETFMSPLADFCGDLPMVAISPQRHLRVFVGDFTGHGLSAAIGALPASDVFYAMTARGLPLRDLLGEMNRKLRLLLTRDMFLAAILADIDLEQGEVEIWNGGMPDVLITNAERRIVARVPSFQLPLATLPNESLRADTQFTSLPWGSSLCIHSDGVVETTNREGEHFGAERLEQLTEALRPGATWTESIVHAVTEFRAGAPVVDDVTAVCIDHGEALASAVANANLRFGGGGERDAGDLGLELRLGGDRLRAPDPLAPLLSFVGEAPELACVAGVLSTVITELYSNAVEHGLLGLDSAIKDQPEGMIEYYRLRAEGMERLRQGWIRLSVRAFVSQATPEVHVEVNDTGPGFEPTAAPRPRSTSAPHGRGLSIVRALSSRVELTEGGRTIRAVLPLTPGA
jgi:CheY-like chemotaxis protein/anti-sigma regulatory factor (Ser/Thr protein kinase)